MNSVILFKYSFVIYPPTEPCNKKHVAAQNKATPSIKADIISAVVLISSTASGCLPIASAADAAKLPIPSPAPIVTKPAPTFKAQAVMPDNSFKEISLSDYSDKKVVLFFYPLDFTFV